MDKMNLVLYFDNNSRPSATILLIPLFSSKCSHHVWIGFYMLQYKLRLIESFSTVMNGSLKDRVSKRDANISHLLYMLFAKKKRKWEVLNC